MTVTNIAPVVAPNAKARKAAKKEAARLAALAALATAPVAPVATVELPANGPMDLGNLDILGGLGGLAPTAPVKVAPRAAKTPGVAPNARTRAYFAGAVLARHGHANGITPEMGAEVDAAYGSDNAIESAICLRNAWHAIRAFMATTNTAMPAAAPVAATVS